MVYNLTLKQIKKIIYLANEINTNKIAKYMEDTNWKWFIKLGETRVPTEDEIYSEILKICCEAFHELYLSTEKEMTLSTGGITITVDRDDNIDYHFSIDETCIDY